MRLALVFGNKSEVMRSKILENRDNLQIDAYSSVSSYMAVSAQRGLEYDRVLLLAGLVREEFAGDFTDLYKYWAKNAAATSFVLICNKGKDDDIGREFVNMFNTPLCVSAMLRGATVTVLTDVCTLDIYSLNDKYGFRDEALVPEKVQEESIHGKQQALEEETVPVQEDSAPKKKGFFSSIFTAKPAKGNKDTKSKENKSETSDSQPNINIQSGNSNTDVSASMEPVNTLDMDNSKNCTGTAPHKEISVDSSDLSGEYYTYESLPDDDFSDVDYQTPTPTVSEGVGTVFEEDSTDSEDAFGDFTDDVTDGWVGTVPDDDFAFGDTALDLPDEQTDGGVFMDEEELDVPENRYSDEPEVRKPVESSKMVVDDDFGSDLLITDDETPDNNRRPVPKKTVASVDDVDVSNLDISSLESSYRAEVEKPKVVEKVVEVEKIVVKNGKVNTPLDAIYSGKSTKIIVVTGDRGSGVTTLALDITKKLSKKVPVLYFDGDVDNHGLLSYIDYDVFRTYEEAHKRGVEICRNVSTFTSCKMNFDNNLDILTCDYSSEVSDEQLQTAQEVVVDVARKYSVVVADVPMDKLHLFPDMLSQGTTLLCTEASLRGFMNTLCRMDKTKLTTRQARVIALKGTMVLTKVSPKFNVTKLEKRVRDIVDFEEIDWVAMEKITRTGEITDDFLNSVID